jgi:hypothetical protein
VDWESTQAGAAQTPDETQGERVWCRQTRHMETCLAPSEKKASHSQTPVTRRTERVWLPPTGTETWRTYMSVIRWLLAFEGGSRGSVGQSPALLGG